MEKQVLACDLSTFLGWQTQNLFCLSLHNIQDQARRLNVIGAFYNNLLRILQPGSRKQ